MSEQQNKSAVVIYPCQDCDVDEFKFDFDFTLTLDVPGIWFKHMKPEKGTGTEETNE